MELEGGGSGLGMVGFVGKTLWWEDDKSCTCKCACCGAVWVDCDAADSSGVAVVVEVGCGEWSEDGGALVVVGVDAEDE